MNQNKKRGSLEPENCSRIVAIGFSEIYSDDDQTCFCIETEDGDVFNFRSPIAVEDFSRLQVKLLGSDRLDRLPLEGKNVKS